MTIAKQLGVKEFPFMIFDNHGNKIYYEDITGYWCKREFDDNGNQIYYENSDGIIKDNRPKVVPEYTMEELVDKLGHNFKIKK
jgi:hypothetical protein